MTRVTVVQKLIEYARSKGIDREKVSYVIVGGATTLVNFGLLTLMHEIIGIDLTVSNVTSILVSILFAYVTNKLIVFKWHCETRKELTREFLKFFSSRLFTLAIEIGGVELFVNVLGMHWIPGKAIPVVIVVILNYVLGKLLVFRRAKEG